jgi:hypothetical protein
VVAIGLSLVVRRTRFALPALMLAAALPGLVLGSAFAVVPRFADDCGARGELTGVANERGSFDGPATVTVRSGCGTLNVTTAPGSEWHLDARNTAGRRPGLEVSGRALTIDGIEDDRWNPFDAGRDAWNLTLPTSNLDALSLAVFAGSGHLELAGADIDRLSLTANAARIVVDASTADVGQLTGVVNVGAMTIRLPAGDLTGSLQVGGGELRICAPRDLGLGVTTRGTGEQVTVNGERQGAGEWQSLLYRSATHHADLRVTLNFGALEIDQIGDCE